MKDFVMTAALCLAGFCASAQVGEMFPNLSGESTDKRAMQLPADCRGKYTLVGMASSMDAQSDLKTWAEPIYRKFISDVKSDIWDETYDVNVYFVPMFTGANQAMAGRAQKQFAANSDAEWLPHVVFYKGDLEPYATSLALTQENIPYVFLLDPDGRIVYSTSGRCTDKKLSDIEDVLDR